MGVRLAADRVRRSALRLRPRGPARLAGHPAHVAAAHGHGAAGGGQLLAAGRAAQADARGAPGEGRRLHRAGRDRGRVPAQLRGTAGGARQHVQLREPAALARAQDGLRARRLGPGERPRPGRPVRLPVRRPPQPRRAEEGGQPAARPGHQRRRLHRRHRRRLRGAPGVPLRDHALLFRRQGRHRPDRPVLRRRQPVVVVHPAVRGDAAGDLLPVHPAGPGPVQGGDLRGHEPGVPPCVRGGRGRVRPGPDR